MLYLFVWPGLLAAVAAGGLCLMVGVAGWHQLLPAAMLSLPREE